MKMIDVYDVYEDDKFRVRFTNLDMAKEFCIETASNNVEGLKRKIYYPILREKYGVEKIKDIPAEIRYKYWDDEKLKYLKEHYYIKKEQQGYTEEEEAAMKERIHKELERRKKKKR